MTFEEMQAACGYIPQKIFIAFFEHLSQETQAPTQDSYQVLNWVFAMCLADKARDGDMYKFEPLNALKKPYNPTRLTHRFELRADILFTQLNPTRLGSSELKVKWADVNQGNYVEMINEICNIKSPSTTSTLKSK